MRKVIVAGNWKMHKTAPKAVELIAALKPLLEGVAVEAVVPGLCPHFCGTSVLFLEGVLFLSAQLHPL